MKRHAGSILEKWAGQTLVPSINSSLTFNVHRVLMRLVGYIGDEVPRPPE
jgi:hypothetical protein